MTLLSAQLLKLRQDTSSVLDVDKRKRASILFTPDEAAKVSYEVVLQLAQSGIETLKEIDSTAVEFSISLFGPNTLELERSLLSKEENDILTEKIKRCLVALSPHMLLRAAQKCFEWLLCRFHIADVQAEDVLLAMLPYHDTNLFTKISCQVKLPQNWRWLKTFKHEPPHRNIVIRELRSNPNILTKFMVLFEEAASDEKNPIVLFCIATTNIIVSQNAKDSILAVIVQNCIKGLQSDKPAARGYAISTLANISLQSTTSSSKLDDALVKKLLKYSLRNESPMNSEALACMGIVYFSSSGEVALPTKFASIAVDLIGRDDIKLNPSKYSGKLLNLILDAAVEIAVTGDDEDVKNVALETAIKLLKLNLKINLDISFTKALEVSNTDAGATLLKQMRKCDPDVMTPKLSSALSELDASTLPPEITIHHDSVAVRRTALEQIAKMGNQDLIKSVLAREIDNGLINIATQKLESDLSNISLMCQVAKNSGNLNSVVNYLLQLLKNKEIERFQKLKVLSQIMSSGHSKSITDAISEFGVSSVCELEFGNFEDLILILTEADDMTEGLSYITRDVCKIKDEAKRVKLATRLLKINQKLVVPDLIGCDLPLNLTDQIAFFSLSDANLTRRFIMEHLTKNLTLEVSKKITIGRYFARLAFRHDWALPSVITVLKVLGCVDQPCPVIEVLALKGMLSASSTVRSDSLNLFKHLCEVNSATDAVSKRILKKESEILSDENQLRQVLSRALKKEGVENWNLINGTLSLSGLTVLLNLCPPVTADYVAPSFITSSSKESDEEFFVALFNLLAHCENEMSAATIKKLRQIWKENNLTAKATSSLILALRKAKVAKKDNKNFLLLLKEMIFYAIEVARSGSEVSSSAQIFFETCDSDQLKYLLETKKTSTGSSVIQAKRQKMNDAELNYDYFLFILDRLSARGFADLSIEINELLEATLQSEGEKQTRIQQRIVGIASKTKCRDIRPEALVEVLRRCSARGSENHSTESPTNLLLVSALSLLSSLAAAAPTKVLQSLMSVFTFMGAGLLPRADDRYSFHSIQETIKCVVPPLLKTSLQTNPLQEILDVFCTALPHVPVHRQVAVFESLIVTCDAENALWRTWLQLATKHVKNINMDEDETIQDHSAYSELMNSLVSRFSVNQVIQASSHITKFLTELPFVKEKQTDKNMEIRSEMDNISMRNLHYFIGFFLSKLFSSHDFLHGQLAQITDEEEAVLVQLYRDLLQACFGYTERIQTMITEDATNEKYFKALNGKINGVIEKILGLLPSTEFAQCITGLIENSLRNKTDWLTTQSLEILCTRLRRHDDFESNDLLSKTVLDQLQAVLKQQKSVLSINLAAKATKLLAKTMASQRPTAFRPILSLLPQVLKSSACQKISAKDSAYGSVILCTAVLISELKITALGDLNWALDAIMSGLDASGDNDTIKTILIASLAKILSSMDSFITPHLQRILQTVCKVEIKTEAGESRVMGCISIISGLSSRVLLPDIAAVYQKMEASQIIQLLVIMEQHIDTLDRGVAIKHQTILQNLFLKALEFRTDNVNKENVSREMIANVENATCKALVRLSLKLPEASLRPLLFNIFNWATADETVTKLFSLYALYGHLAMALKSMFPIFTGSLASHLIQILPKIGGEKTLVDTKTDKRELLVGILSVLQPIFLYDNGEFLDEGTINELLPLVINLLEQTDIDDYDEFCEKYLIGSIAQAASAISDDSIWRPLNYRILLKTRHEDPFVRIAALKCIDAVVDKLGDDYQSLLQESAPQFFAELLEDDDARVEKKMSETVTKMEALFGESLQSYF